jgi:hypothetical protein
MPLTLTITETALNTETATVAGIGAGVSVDLYYKLILNDNPETPTAATGYTSLATRTGPGSFTVDLPKGIYYLIAFDGTSIAGPVFMESKPTGKQARAAARVVAAINNSTIRTTPALALRTYLPDYEIKETVERVQIGVAPTQIERTRLTRSGIVSPYNTIEIGIIKKLTAASAGNRFYYTPKRNQEIDNLVALTDQVVALLETRAELYEMTLAGSVDIVAGYDAERLLESDQFLAVIRARYGDRA